MNERRPTSAMIASVTAGAMIAHQVAGKAVRDALFLSSFEIELLPRMMAASAVLSLAAAFWISRAMVRYTPAKVVPGVFAASAAALVVEWATSFVAPRLTALALYFHTALFGAVMISAFWSLINESFTPYSGRRAVQWVTSGGTLGGVIGGVAAWKAADLIAIRTVLPVLAVADVICVWGTWRLCTLSLAPPPIVRASADSRIANGLRRDWSPPSTPRLIRETPYLRNLAIVIGLGAVTSGLLDYVLSAVAVESYADAAQLLSFFAKFWLIVGLISFLLETLLGRVSLDKLGLTVSVALLPATVVLGSVVAIAFPGLLVMAVLRGSEASQRNSIFRAAYELLYTPVAAEKKRAAKTFIDVVCDRAGTIVAGAIAMVAVALFAPASTTLVVLVASIVCGLVSVAWSITLHRGYVSLLEDGLHRATVRTTAAQAIEETALRDRVIDSLAPAPSPRASAAAGSIEDDLRAVLDLSSGDTERMRAVLLAKEPFSSRLVAFAIPLLAHRTLSGLAITALVRAAPSSSGQLVDALVDIRFDVRIRRLIARILARSPTRVGTDGLLNSIVDDQFEVRFACGRALLKIRAASPDMVITLERVVEIVASEVGRENPPWTRETESGEGVAGSGAMLTRVERFRGDRVDRGIEHVFNLLALHFDHEALRTSFRALHDENLALRGTALEYLELVLPHELRRLVWPVIGERHAMRNTRSSTDILADMAGGDG